MQFDMKRLLSFYKLISVIGVSSVIAPAFYLLLASTFPWQLSLLLTCSLFPASIGLGYLCQWLLLGQDERLKKQTVDFNFEQKITIPKKQRRLGALAALLAGGVLGLLCSILFSKLDLTGFGELLSVYCAVCAYVGVRLCRASFNQLLGIRSILECCAAFVVYALLGSYVVFFALMVYVLCLFIELNQESILQSAKTSDTCRITPEILRTGIGLVFKAWGRAVLIAIVLVSVYTTLMTAFYFAIGVTRFRMETANEYLSDFEILFYDVPSRIPVLNCIFFVLGIVIFIVGIIFLLGRRRHLQSVCLLMLRQWFDTALGFVRRFFLDVRYQKKKSSIPAVSLTANYTDTVVKIKRPVRRRTLNYPSFVRRLKALDSEREQYAYAYRTLIAFMVQREIGVEEHHTPTEAAQIIAQKTNYQEIGALTSLFTQMTYAKDRQIDVGEVKQATNTCCYILERIIATV